MPKNPPKDKDKDKNQEFKVRNRSNAVDMGLPNKLFNLNPEELSKIKRQEIPDNSDENRSLNKLVETDDYKRDREEKALSDNLGFKQLIKNPEEAQIKELEPPPPLSKKEQKKLIELNRANAKAQAKNKELEAKLEAREIEIVEEYAQYQNDINASSAFLKREFNYINKMSETLQKTKHPELNEEVKQMLRNFNTAIKGYNSRLEKSKNDDERVAIHGDMLNDVVVSFNLNLILLEMKGIPIPKITKEPLQLPTIEASPKTFTPQFQPIKDKTAPLKPLHSTKPKAPDPSEPKTSEPSPKKLGR